MVLHKSRYILSLVQAFYVPGEKFFNLVFFFTNPKNPQYLFALLITALKHFKQKIKAGNDQY